MVAPLGKFVGKTVSKRGRKRKPRGRKPANPEDTKVAKRLGISVPELKLKRAAAKKKKPIKKAPTPLTKKEERELKLLIRAQSEDIKAQDKGEMSKLGRERRKELMTKAQYYNSTPFEKKVGIGSGTQVGSEVMSGKSLTKTELKELEDYGFINLDDKKYGGKVKRRMGGVIKKGFGKANRGY